MSAFVFFLCRVKKPTVSSVLIPFALIDHPVTLAYTSLPMSNPRKSLLGVKKLSCSGEGGDRRCTCIGRRETRQALHIELQIIQGLPILLSLSSITNPLEPTLTLPPSPHPRLSLHAGPSLRSHSLLTCSSSYALWLVRPKYFRASRFQP